jgi:DNA mismatch repair protein MutL
VLGQAATIYIIAEGPEGLYLIDQHAAHERILFEKFLAQRQARQVERQGLLEPLTIEVTPQQEEALKSQADSLAGYGFELENFGHRAYLVRAVPALLPGQNLAAALNEVLDCLAEADVSRREERIAISLACHSSVRAGQVLGEEEMRQLVRQLEQTNQPRTCPHGRPTMIHLSASQLDREFGRR